MAVGDDLVTFLRLAPEFGGTRFGPFEGLEVRLGSNADRCHIVLPESLGVTSEHARLIRQGPQNLILSPAERTAAVFLWKAGERRPHQLNTPTAVRAGDAFSLVTPDGPRFIIELDELPPEVQAQRDAAQGKKRGGVGRGRLSAKSMGNEVKRQAWTRLLVMGPLQLLQRAMVYVRSGAIYQPRNIILGLTIASGWLFGGAMTCSRVRTGGKLQTATVKYENCQQDLSFADGMGDDSTEYNFAELAARVTKSRRLGTGLEQDQNLRAEVEKRSVTVLANSKQYNWLLTGRDKQADSFANWREMLAESTDIDEDTKALTMWLAAYPGKLRGEFEDMMDSESTDVCGRGPTRMTYRQAVHLGLNVQADALYMGMSSALDSKAKREELLGLTLTTAQQPIPEGTIETELAPIRQGTGYCIYVTGEDDRTRFRKVLNSLEKHIGPESTGVPNTGAPSASTARIAKYWASDLTLVDFTRREPGIEFGNDTVPSAVLDGYQARGKWVMERTAETIAQSVVLPCLAVLNGKPERVKQVLGEDNLPNPVHCLVLAWKLQHQGA